jgi:Methyltransferase domain
MTKASLLHQGKSIGRARVLKVVYTPPCRWSVALQCDKLPFVDQVPEAGMPTVDSAEPAGIHGASAGDDDTAQGSRFGWEAWTWDECLFEGAARYYLRGRIPYAEGPADSLAKVLGLDRRGRLLDVGCGPGIIVLRIAHLFERMVGLDPDAAMLEEARLAACQQGAENASWVLLRAEDRRPEGAGATPRPAARTRCSKRRASSSRCWCE